MQPKDSLDPDKIKANLQTKAIGREIVVFNSAESTNDIAGEYAADIENNGLVILTEEQTAGRGRTGNKWLSDSGDSILCSIVLTDTGLNGELLTLLCAVAVAETIGKIGNNTAAIKWPNDIIVNGKKIAGILLESCQHKSARSYILGIGINCHQKSFPRQIQSVATSIDIESRAVCDRNFVVKRLLTSIEYWLDTAERNTDKVIKQWNNLSLQLGHEISLLYDGRQFAGNCIGIDPQKGLIVQLYSGSVRMFPAASTSIVK